MSLAEKHAEQKKIIIDYFRALPVYKHAANAAGITDDTLKKWRDEDPEFSAQLKKAESEFYGSKVKKARPEFLLERLDRETFGQKEETNTTNIIALILQQYSQEGKNNGVVDIPTVKEITERPS